MYKRGFIFLNSNLEFKSCNLKASIIRFLDPLNVERFFERFDFADEWNNLGYGRIETNGSKFAISDLDLKEEEFDKVLAIFQLSDGSKGVYAGIKGNDIVFNREIGPVDGLEVCLIEEFLSETGPLLIDIPFTYKSAVTMRIDCDESIASGKKLADLYTKHLVPFSMAIKTDQPIGLDSINLINDVLVSGGSILSHSHTHAPNWGGSREKAVWEANSARERLREILPSNYNMDFVVSPFHQNPKYAVEGLRDAGIKGFVGGIIKNDPEYLVSRASWAKDVPGIMTHSQQCMLHGDCYHNAGNSLDIYKQSFENHYKTNTFFGYLDHPFSSYQYGWLSEEERLGAHEEFILNMKTFDGIWFANLVDAMSFLWVKVNTKVWVEDEVLKWSVPSHNYKNLPDLCVLWKGEKHRVPIHG
jgi:hypothetical protein